MIKKLDKLQVSLIVGYVLLVILMLALPYREAIATGEIKNGYRHLINWLIIGYSTRIVLNSFGWELFGIEKHLFAIIGLELSGVYVKLFIFKENYNAIFSGILGEVITIVIFCGLVYLDKTLYYTGNKKDYEISMDKFEQED